MTEKTCPSKCSPSKSRVRQLPITEIPLDKILILKKAGIDESEYSHCLYCGTDWVTYFDSNHRQHKKIIRTMDITNPSGGYQWKI